MSTAWSRKGRGEAQSWEALGGRATSVEQLTSGPTGYHPPPTNSAAATGAGVGMAAAAMPHPAPTPASLAGPAAPGPAPAALNPYHSQPQQVAGHGEQCRHGHSHGGGAGHGHSHGGAGAGMMPALTGSDRDLFVACGAGNLDLVKRLVAMGGDVRSFDAKGATALHWAALNNQTAVVRYLLAEGADPNAPNSVSLQTPLHWAAGDAGDEWVCDLLLEAGANARAEDSASLRVACRIGNEAMVRLLLTYGAAADADDNAPLRAAVFAGHTGIIDILCALPDGAGVDRRIAG